MASSAGAGTSPTLYQTWRHLELHKCRVMQPMITCVIKYYICSIKMSSDVYEGFLPHWINLENPMGEVWIAQEEVISSDMVNGAAA